MGLPISATLMCLLMDSYGFHFNLLGNRTPDGNMGAINVDIDRILQRGYLYQLHFIARKATQFEEFNGKGVDGKLTDNPFLASFQVCDGIAQRLFRLILSKDKNT